MGGLLDREELRPPTFVILRTDAFAIFRNQQSEFHVTVVLCLSVCGRRLWRRKHSPPATPPVELLRLWKLITITKPLPPTGQTQSAIIGTSPTNVSFRRQQPDNSFFRLLKNLPMLLKGIGVGFPAFGRADLAGFSAGVATGNLDFGVDDPLAGLKRHEAPERESEEADSVFRSEFPGFVVLVVFMEASLPIRERLLHPDPATVWT